MTSDTAGAAVAPAATPALSQVWTAHVADGPHKIVLSSPNVANLTGGPSVVVGDQSGHVYAYHLADGSTVPGWPFTSGASVTSTPSIAPGPGTGRDTVLVGVGNAAASCAGGYQWIRPTGNNTFVNATNPTTDAACANSGVQASMAVGSLQGVTATVAGSMGENEYAFNTANAATLGGFPWFQGDTDLSTPAIADIVGNGTNQIVEGGASTAGLAYNRQYQSGGHILVLNDTGNAGTGTPAGGLVCERTTNQQVTSSPAVGQFLAGTAVGIVAGTGNFYGGASDSNKLYALNNGCGVAWVDSLAGTTTGSPALADVLGNGKLQVVETTRTGTVYALNGADGSVLWHTKLPATLIGSPVTADLGTGYQDVLVSGANGFYVLDGTSGAVVDSLLPNVGFQNSPLVTQDPTGAIGITVAGYVATSGSTTGSYLYHYRVTSSNGSAVHESGAWPQFHHDAQLTGNAGTPPPVVQVTCKGKAPSSPNGYYLAGSDGGIFDYGNLPFCGSTGNLRLNQPVVGITASPSANGYWEVASDGGIFAFGTVTFFGSMGGKPLNRPVVGIAANPNGHGYWEVASDGGLFAFGTAPFHGSMGGKPLNAPIVGMAATPTGNGYWEVASDGGIFAFGTATFYGSMGGKPLNQPVVGIAANPNGHGYWEVAADGGIFAFGTAPFHGSMGGKPLNAPIVGMSPSRGGNGYRFVAADGGIFSFTATFFGSRGGQPLNKPIVGMAGF
ncbi:MAG: PQQ-binding-like beta-propeller repeat protein [Acidimicrobiales bacterium]